jgi:HSP20 family protein
MSFLDKLKRKVDILEENQPSDTENEKQKSDVLNGTNFTQLDVDIYETASRYVVLAAIPGVDSKKVDISVGEQNDVLIIQGAKESPMDQLKLPGEKILPQHTECMWGNFYRQIILPQEVNPDAIEAFEENGILVIILPLLRLAHGKKSIEVSIKD